MFLQVKTTNNHAKYGFFFERIHPFKTINKLKLFFECGIPMPQDTGTPLLALLQFF
jgi:hypothetical protein